MQVRSLSPELQEKAIVELNEVPSRLRDDLNHIQEWIRQQPHLNARSEEQWLLNFLRGCKFSLRKTKEKLHLYYTLRTISPHHFENRNPFSHDVQTSFKLAVCAVLPRKYHSLAPMRILLIARNGDPDKLPIKVAIRSALMLGDISIYEDDASIVNGLEVIFDLKDMPYRYGGQCTASTLKSISILLQGAYPVRLKGAHFINVPPFIYAVIKTFKTFLSKKLRDRLHIYLENDFDNLYKYIPRDVFPEEYGGNAGPLCDLTEQLRHKLESYQKWFEEDAKYCTDESKRPGKPITSDEFFNMEGSFRQLQID